MTNKDLKQAVQNALDWEPSVDPSDIGVSADEGVVTLRGNVRTYDEKHAAERAALSIFGVSGVANDLAVRLPTAFERTDTEIAQAAVIALKWNSVVPLGGISVSVSDGWVTLTGDVQWQYQKDAAAGCVRDLIGVKGVTNTITVQPHVKPLDVRTQIEAASTAERAAWAAPGVTQVEDHLTIVR